MCVRAGDGGGPLRNGDGQESMQRGHVTAAVQWGGRSVGANNIPLAGATYVQRPQPTRPPF